MITQYEELWRHILFNYMHDIRIVSRMPRHISMIPLFDIVHSLGLGAIGKFPFFKKKNNNWEHIQVP